MAGTVWTKFFWQDWAADPALRMCSFAAQGLWMRMLCLAADADPIGYVVVNGKPLDSSAIARLTGGTEQEVLSLIDELDQNGVLSRDRRGAIYNRRMVRDAKKIAHARKVGKTGGNPNLCKDKGNSAQDNPRVKGRDNTHKPEAKSHKPDNPQSPQGGGGQDDLVSLRGAISRAFEEVGSDRFPDTSRAGVWLAKGYSAALILAVVRECLAKNKKIRDLRYFENALAEAHEKRGAEPAAPEAPADPAKTRRVHLAWAKGYLLENRWSDSWGPRRGEGGCPVPDDVWQEAEGIILAERAALEEALRGKPNGVAARH